MIRFLRTCGGSSGSNSLRLLLDTHVLIWVAAEDRRLRPYAMAAIERATSDVFVSIASIWEIAIKTGLGRLGFPVAELEDILASMRFRTLDIAVHHALAAGALPRHHGDPFDRMLVAQSQAEDLMLVSADRAIRRYDVRWLDPLREERS